MSANLFLDRLGSLSSNRGGPDARKAAGVHQDLTGQESQFPEATVKPINRRAAESAYDPDESVRPITMRDLQALQAQPPSFRP